MADRTQALEEMLEGFHAMKSCLASRHRPLEGKLPLTWSQWLVLGVIARKGPIPVSGIADALRISRSAATQSVNELVKSGHAKKAPDEHDARTMRVSLSSKTQKALSTVRKAALANMRKLFSALSDKEFAQYITLHRKLARGCGK
ncbi:MAG: MarR family transcriptional regulator [Patescibacteria group bacterium]|nr:MarR family transcriptional regulator [Patescibacteria group bacterium]MDE1965921.1 MarR family transcriptional regulator [Patescibacteria group bacterium]